MSDRPDATNQRETAGGGFSLQGSKVGARFIAEQRAREITSSIRDVEADEQAATSAGAEPTPDRSPVLQVYDNPAVEAAPDQQDRHLDHVPTGDIHPSRLHLRKRLDADALHSLALSVREKGITQPLLLRRRRHGESGYDLVAGYRRWRAACLADLLTIPALIIDDLDDRDSLEFALVENLQRSDLTVVEEAEAYRLLTERYGRTHQEIGDLTGKSRSHVSNMIRLLGLPAEVREMLDSGQINFGHARALLAADDPVSLARRIVAEGLNVRDIEKAGRRGRRTARQVPAANEGEHAELKAVATELKARLGTAVDIDLDGDRPTLNVRARSPEQLLEIARRINEALQFQHVNAALERTTRADSLI